LDEAQVIVNVDVELGQTMTGALEELQQRV
jgi:hypothetical protein